LILYIRPEIKEACVDQIGKNLLYWEEQKKEEEVFQLLKKI